MQRDKREEKLGRKKQTKTEHKCPFYLQDKGIILSCTGFGAIVETRIPFVTCEAKQKHMDIYCNGCYFRCSIAEQLNKTQKKYKVYRCKNNKFVDCAKRSECASCGWNPEVAHNRLEKFRQKMERGE